MDSHQEDEEMSRMAERDMERQQEAHAEDQMMEFEMSVDEFRVNNLYNMKLFHDFLYHISCVKILDRKKLGPDAKRFLKESDEQIIQFTNNSATPELMVVLLGVNDIMDRWTLFLRMTFLNTFERVE